jgi:hypothetical protein
MSPGVIVAIVVIVVLVVAAAAWFYTQRRRSEQLRERFGPEYDRAVEEHGDRTAAERALQERQAQVEQLDIRPLSPQESERFGTAWREAQARFVDDPVAAIKEADRLVQEVMGARGYPMGDFDARASLVSVNHPHVVSNYRAAHDIAQRNARGEANTEDLRQAMVHYRALFEELLETETVPQPRANAEPAQAPTQAKESRPQGEALVPEARPLVSDARPAEPAEREGRRGRAA